MTTHELRHPVTSIDELESLIGLPSELAVRKQLSQLDAHAQSFVASSPFLLLGTFDGAGRCDVSPRGDLPCVATVLDANTLVIPERRGNRRIDSLRNVVETGRAGLLFLVPGSGETLRVNGGATVDRGEEFLAPLSARGVAPLVGIVVDVEECYFQCAKAVIRSRLWEHAATDDRPAVPHLAEILMDQTHPENETLDSLRERIEESYRENLY